MWHLVKNNYIKGEKVCLLRILPGKLLSGTSLHIPYYMKLKNTIFTNLRIYLVDNNLEYIKSEEDNNSVLTCTLHFQPLH